MAKRCPNGSRKNRKTGNCVRKTGTVLNSLSPINKTKKRCPNGTRRNKKTGNCMRKKSPVKKMSIQSASPNTFHSARNSGSTGSFYTPPEYKRGLANINRAT